jgi:hypothetical protein
MPAFPYRVSSVERGPMPGETGAPSHPVSSSDGAPGRRILPHRRKLRNNRHR